MREDWDMETTVLLISLAIIPVLVAIILLCLKIKASKSNPDLFGVEGTVKKTKNDDAYAPANTSENLNVSGDDSNVRTPSYDRKLPDIPNDEIYKNSTKEDTNSELYATVDEMPNNLNLSTHPDINIPPGPSNFDPKNHPYAKVKKTRRQEHPYAKVGENKDNEDNTDTEEYDTTENLLEVRPQSSQRSSGRSLNAPSLGTWVSPPRRPDEIPRNPSRQATPLPPEPPFNEGTHQQQHFSGDSQDSFSAKGYTSISVREPLSMIRDIRQIGPSQPPIQEGNYVTLSETSDEMYAAIEDTVYMNPGGKDSSAEKDDEESDPNNMYSKVDKTKKRNDRQTKSYDPSNSYARVNKPTAGKNLSHSNDNLGARPKQRSPRTSVKLEDIDYSEYEVTHSDHPAYGEGPSHRLSYDNTQPRTYNMNRSYHEEYRPRVDSNRDPGYETVPYAESQLSERDPGYEVVPQNRRIGKDPDYETVPSELKDPGYESVPHRNRVNSIDPGYESVPQKREPGYESVPRKEPGYESVKQRHDPGYETVNNHTKQLNKGHSYGPRSFPPDYESVIRERDPGYESVGFKDPGYETVPQKRTQSLEPGYETVPERIRESSNSEVRYSKVNKKQRAAPAARTPGYQDGAVVLENDLNYETLPEMGKLTGNISEEEGYETIPEDQRKTMYDPEYETLPQERGPSDPGYETIPKRDLDVASEAASTDPDYARLKDADIEFIDESADEIDDEIGRLQTDEDVTVESSQSSSLIHMSVVDSGPGVRRSSVVVIEHVDMTPVPSADSSSQMDEEQDINTHIFV